MAAFPSLIFGCRGAEAVKKNIRAVLNKIDSGSLALKLKNELLGREIEVIGVTPENPVVFEACLDSRVLDR